MKLLAFNLSLGLVLPLIGCQANPTSHIQMCEQTVHDYALLRDEGPAQDYANLFIAEGTFELGSTITQGHKALIERHVAANEAAVWRHTMTDIRISDDLTGTSRFIVHTGPKSDAPDKVIREIIGDYKDVFEIKDGKCQIKSRKVKVVFDSQ